MYPFDPKRGLVLVKVTVSGVSRTEEAVFALDTGATTTVINLDLLKRLGYSKKDDMHHVTITTGSGTEKTSIIKIRNLRALDIQKQNFPILAYQLPITTFVDGLLGLDFFRKRKLEIDFSNGTIKLQ